MSSGYLGDSVAVLQVGGFREALRLVKSNVSRLKTLIYLFICLFICLFIYSRDRASLCIPGCPGTHSLDQAGLRDWLSSASRVLGLNACATIARL